MRRKDYRWVGRQSVESKSKLTISIIALESRREVIYSYRQLFHCSPGLGAWGPRANPLRAFRACEQYNSPDTLVASTSPAELISNILIFLNLNASRICVFESHRNARQRARHTPEIRSIDEGHRSSFIWMMGKLGENALLKATLHSKWWDEPSGTSLARYENWKLKNLILSRLLFNRGSLKCCHNSIPGIQSDSSEPLSSVSGLGLLSSVVDF
jgi:hypothetical protein